MIYEIHSQDPGGKFVETLWGTETLPRQGDCLMLPTDHVGSGWQELTVMAVEHYPGVCKVWIGETDGWEAGSVIDLFANAGRYKGGECIVTPGARRQ